MEIERTDEEFEALLTASPIGEFLRSAIAGVISGLVVLVFQAGGDRTIVGGLALGCAIFLGFGVLVLRNSHRWNLIGRWLLFLTMSFVVSVYLIDLWQTERGALWFRLFLSIVLATVYLLGAVLLVRNRTRSAADPRLESIREQTRRWAGAAPDPDLVRIEQRIIDLTAQLDVLVDRSSSSSASVEYPTRARSISEWWALRPSRR